MEDRTAARLKADVYAILGDNDLRTNLGLSGPPDALKEKLFQIWNGIEERYRYALRHHRLLPESARRSRTQVAQDIGLQSVYEVLELEQACLQFVRIGVSPQPGDNFPGLRLPIPRIIHDVAKRHGIPADPAHLPRLILDMAWERGFGPKKYRWLLEWLRDHGHQALIDELMAALATTEAVLPKSQSAFVKLEVADLPADLTGE